MGKQNGDVAMVTDYNVFVTQTVTQTTNQSIMQPSRLSLSMHDKAS